MIKVDHNGEFQRVSGTMIGGGTLVGLSSLLTGVNDFDKIIEMCQIGDNKQVDMLVKDIYGDKMPFKGLEPDWLASSFSKVAVDSTTKGEDMH